MCIKIRAEQAGLDHRILFLWHAFIGERQGGKLWPSGEIADYGESRIEFNPGKMKFNPHQGCFLYPAGYHGFEHCQGFTAYKVNPHDDQNTTGDFQQTDIIFIGIHAHPKGINTYHDEGNGRL